jgi:chemotaxis protein methyltransferase CheR
MIPALPLDANGWTRVSENVARHMGLHFPPARLHDLQRGLGAAARALGEVDPSGLCRRLRDAPLDPPLLRLLARHLTVGETYFFRDPALFNALRSHVLPPLIDARRKGSRRLRLWSAACASGEEPYSLAILLHQLLPDIDEWDVRILATDLNPDALEKAADGVYGDWSFRQAPASLKQVWFQQRSDGRHVIDERARRLVRFEPLNLVEDAGLARKDADAADIILCRNVLMYFTPEQATRVARRLHGTVAEGGWLAVSPCEVSQRLFTGFTTVNFPNAVLYHKSPATPAAPPPRAPAPARAATQPRAMARSRPAGAATRTAAPRIESQPHASGEAFAREARALADQGRMDEALAVCARWIAADKLDAGAHYLQAIILAELSRLSPARASLKAALFLDPDFVLAHVALLDLARRAGQPAEAERHLGAARDLLRRLDADERLREGEGLSAGALAGMLAAAGAAS